MFFLVIRWVVQHVSPGGGFTCEQLAATTPVPPPVFPGSELVDREDISDTPWSFWYKLYYVVPESPDVVQEYYERFLTDGCFDLREERGFSSVSCSGSDRLYGKYRVEIDYSDLNVTNYEINVSQERCTPVD